METKKVKHYLSSSYTMTNPKSDIKKILDPKGFASFYVRENYGKEKVVKTYFDNQNFFRSRGLNISIVQSSSLPRPQLVVRLENNVERLMFLQDMPEKFVKDIGEHDSVLKYQSYITECINDIFPHGLDTKVEQVVAGLKPIMVITKRQEKIRMINNLGLKYFMHYGRVEYHNLINGVRDRQEQFDVVLDYAKDIEQFRQLTHRIEIQVPTILKLNSSDLINAFNFTQLKK